MIYCTQNYYVLQFAISLYKCRKGKTIGDPICKNTAPAKTLQALLYEFSVGCGRTFAVALSRGSSGSSNSPLLGLEPPLFGFQFLPLNNPGYATGFSGI
jgi:hypothetical protein